MADIKNFLYAWCGKKKLTPSYDIRAAGNKNRQKFMCEVRVQADVRKRNSEVLAQTLLPAGPSRELQLHRDGKLHQQKGRSDQRRPGLCQLSGPNRGDDGSRGPGSRGQEGVPVCPDGSFTFVSS